MWARTNNDLIGSKCEFANEPVNSITDPVLPEYLTGGFHCAIGNANPAFGKGEECGKCYRLQGLSSDTKGTAVVMVSNEIAEGGKGYFDCILPSFYAITGAATGKFHMTFEEVTCDLIKGGPVVINWLNEVNAYYCKIMFENVGRWGSLESIEQCIDGPQGKNCGKLERLQGQTWTGCPKGKGSSVEWKLTQKSPKGGTETISCKCSGAWPWDPKHRCSCPNNFR